jgi:hypothetical protein
MINPWPRTLEELESQLAALDAELSRSLILLEHVSMMPRDETVAEYVRRTRELEGLVRALMPPALPAGVRSGR